ncbi:MULTISPECIES: hypothetical protein [unclassified Nocardioides]|uniref:hypothetical protein n=1 Tax=unclassified Nocardioides TaxID=2615069 RepID=UPI003014641B
MSTPLDSGRHPVNVGHLVMGLAFLGLVAVWAVVQSDVIDDDAIRWLLPVPWVLAGAAGLVASVLSGRRHTQRQVGWVPPAGTAEEADPADDPADDTRSFS